MKPTIKTQAIILSVICGITILYFGSLPFSKPEMFSQDDIPNWLTGIIGLVAAVIIAWFIYLLQEKQAENTRKIIEEQHEHQNRRKRSALTEIQTELNELKDTLELAKEENQKSNLRFKEFNEIWKPAIEFSVARTQRMTGYIIGDISFELAEALRAVSKIPNQKSWVGRGVTGGVPVIDETAAVALIVDDSLDRVSCCQKLLVTELKSVNTKDGSLKQVTHMASLMRSIHNDKLDRASRWATIIGTSFAIPLLIFAVLGIQSSNNMLEEAKQSTENMRVLIDKSNKQLQALNNTVTQISHQTVMQEYLNGAPFKVTIEDCGYDEQNKKINYRPVILDKNGNLTPLKFISVEDFFYYGLTNEYGKPGEGDTALLVRHERLIEPGRQKNYELSFSKILEETRNLKESYLLVRSQYYIAPYSEAMDSILTDYVHDKKGHLMIAFNKNETTGQWEILRTNPNSVCK